MLILAFKSYPERFSNIWDLVSSPFTLSNFIGDGSNTGALQSNSFGKYFLNSVICASAVTIGNVIFCLMTGYALARKKFKLNAFFLTAAIAALAIPQQIIMIPLYRLMAAFHWINSYYALIIPWLVSPFGIFLVRQYLINIPPDIEDAARIDGAGEWKILFKVVAPLCMPILTALAIYVFLANWNSFLFPFLFANDDNFYTLPVGLAFYVGKQSIDWGRLMAGASISALPIIFLFIFFQKKIIQGLTAGALKE